MLHFAIEVTRRSGLRHQYRAGELQLSFPAFLTGPTESEYSTDLGLANWQLLQEITVTLSQTVYVLGFRF